MCNYCGNSIETELHVLRDCPLVMPIWLNVVDVRMRSSFFVGELNQWIALNLTSSKRWNKDADWKDLLGNGMPLYLELPASTKSDYGYCRSGTAVQKCRNVMQQTTKAEIMVCWKPPMEGWVKLNTDGAYKDESAAGCSGVIRDSHGGWIGGFAKYLGICSAYVAELWGVLEGLRYARNHGFTRIELNVDSSVVDQICYDDNGSN
jgi:hypothetical protein